MRLLTLATPLLALSACTDLPDPPKALPVAVHAIALADLHALIVADAVSDAQDAGSIAFDGTPIPRAPDATSSDGTADPLGLPIATAGAIGLRHACVLSRGDVWCWGDNTGGAVGAHRACGSQPSGTDASSGDAGIGCDVDPALMPTLPAIKAIAAGDDVSCALADDADGRVYCWGTATEGRLGGSFVSALGTPEPVRLAAHATQLRIQHATACAIDDAQRAWCWGRGFGETPVLARDDRGPLAGVVDIAVGARHSCAIAADGLECWGDNRNGQVAGAASARACPAGDAHCTVGATIIPIAATKVVVGDRHSCALATDGSVQCWGDNELGQLGRTDAYLEGDPAPADLSAPAIDVVASFGRTCAVTTDHQAWCFGTYDSADQGSAQ